MKYKEILKTLEIIEGSLDDAFYSLPEYNANTESRDYIDNARNEVYCLRDEIQYVADLMNKNKRKNNAEDN